MCGHFSLGQVPKDPKILVLAPIAGMSLPFTTELHCYNKNSEKNVEDNSECFKRCSKWFKMLYKYYIIFFSDSHTLIRNISNMKYQG